jgi:hypothetical protein
MASLPSLPHLKTDNNPSPAKADTKLSLARRLRDEDQSRRTTSVAPPASR